MLQRQNDGAHPKQLRYRGLHFVEAQGILMQSVGHTLLLSFSN